MRKKLITVIMGSLIVAIIAGMTGSSCGGFRDYQIIKKMDTP